jgi:hypothetical protein
MSPEAGEDWSPGDRLLTVSFSRSKQRGCAEVVGYNPTTSWKLKGLARSPAISIVVDEVLPPRRRPGSQTHVGT